MATKLPDGVRIKIIVVGANGCRLIGTKDSQGEFRVSAGSSAPIVLVIANDTADRSYRAVRVDAVWASGEEVLTDAVIDGDIPAGKQDAEVIATLTAVTGLNPGEQREGDFTLFVYVEPVE